MTPTAPPRFRGGTNLALKIPRFRFDETVRFYRDTLRLPHLGRRGASEVFELRGLRLWLDCVDAQSQTDVWLQLHVDDVAAATDYLRAAGTPIRDELEPLGDLDAHWISDPAGVVLLVSRGDDEEELT